MRNRFFSFLLGIGIALASQALLAQESSGWLAFGDLRGHFEPCGCDPSSDYGGIVRLATLLKRERAFTPNLWLFNLGNNLSWNTHERYKDEFLIQAISSYKPDASLLNQLELDALDRGVLLPESHNYVLSNYRQKLPWSFVSEFKILKETIVLSYVYSKSTKNGLLRKFDEVLEKKWRTFIKNSKAKKSFLLFSSDRKDLEAITSKKIFDEIISANTEPLGKEVNTSEIEDESRLQRMSNGVWMVPHGGQGVLRGGILKLKRAKSLQEIFDEQSCKNDPFSGLRMDCSDELVVELNHVSWLDKSYEVGSPLRELYRNYEKASANRFQLIAEQRKSELKHSDFVGSDVCRSCHQKEYEIWKASAHAQAMTTLVKKSKQEDPECVSCHVLGYRQKGGFVSLKHSPLFANVHCENCHGARKQHIQNPKKQAQKKSAREVCVSCHHGTHTPNFDFERYWSKIAH